MGVDYCGDFVLLLLRFSNGALAIISAVSAAARMAVTNRAHVQQKFHWH
jgi:hypothetical protein